MPECTDAERELLDHLDANEEERERLRREVLSTRVTPEMKKELTDALADYRCAFERRQRATDAISEASGLQGQPLAKLLKDLGWNE